MKPAAALIADIRAWAGVLRRRGSLPDPTMAAGDMVDIAAKLEAWEEAAAVVLHPGADTRTVTDSAGWAMLRASRLRDLLQVEEGAGHELPR